MIYFFSGTGNSKHVAQHLATLLGENSTEITLDTQATADERHTGIVFPVYAWGVPNIVAHFIAMNASSLASSQYIYSVMTCGDDIGYADRILSKALHGRLQAAFSVPMPNTYVCLPGFDTDSDEAANRKVSQTTAMLPHIADSIMRQEHVTRVTRGDWPWLKTHVLRPLFNSLLVTDRYFRTTSACTLCKKCVRECPTHNIEADGQHIRWQHYYCTGCLRCYHSCPQRAIEFGPFTKGKKQKKQLSNARKTT